MSVEEAFRSSAAAINEHFGGQPVILSRSLSIFEGISGNPPILVARTASAGSSTLTLFSLEDLAGHIDPGTTVTIPGHSLIYTVQSSTVVVDDFVLTILPFLEFNVGGETVALTARQLSFTGRQSQLGDGGLPAGWKIAAQDETWILVPPTTNAGSEPREGDLMSSPISARVREVSGRAGVRYLCLMSRVARQEAA